MEERYTYSDEEWIQLSNHLILEFISIEKRHIKESGGTDTSDKKIIDELFRTIKERMEK